MKTTIRMTEKTLSRDFKLLMFFNLILFFFILFVSKDAMGAVLPDDFSHELVADGMTGPVGLTFLPDGRILVIEQQGTVRLVVNGVLQADPILDIQDQVRYSGEQGLLGIAVDPGYPTRPFIYLYYTHGTVNSQYITRFTMTGTLTDPNGTDLIADPASYFYLLTDIPRDNSNHNGGTLRFGTDGMLYAGPGDDAGGCVAQMRDDLRGVILRMDVSGLPLDNSQGDQADKAEMVPADNPFASASDDNEKLVWAYGLRNPFRFSIDSATGNLFIGDVGAGTYEEVSLSVPPGGENFGWPYREGYDTYSSTCDGNTEPLDTVAPIGGYYQVSGSNSVMGGVVYHAVNFPNDLSWPAEFDGDYFFADYYQGFLIRLQDQGDGTWAVPASVPGQPSPEYFITELSSPSDFVIGPDGAIYYTSQWSDSVYRIGYAANILVSPEPVDFGNVTEGTSSDQTVTITNSGNTDLEIYDIALADPLAAPFSILNDNCSGQTLTASANCTLSVRFSPTTTGTSNDSFDIPNNVPNENPVTVDVSGTGLSSVTNNPPSAPELVYPADGQTGLGTTVEFRWNPSTDPDGDTVTYDFFLCDDPDPENCGAPVEVASSVQPQADPEASGPSAFSHHYAGILLFGIALAGIVSRKRRIALLIMMIILTGMLLVSCSSDNSGGNGGSTSNEVSYTPPALSQGTPYSWKVIAKDGNGGETESETRSFTTL